VGDGVSHAESELTDQIKVPGPALETLTFCEAGFDPYSVALKLKASGVTSRIGDVMTNVTVTVFGVLVALPEAVNVRCPV